MDPSEQLAQPLRHAEISEVEHVAAQRREEGGDVASRKMRGEAHGAAKARHWPIDVRAMRDQQFDDIDGVTGNGVVQSALHGFIRDVDVHSKPRAAVQQRQRGLGARDRELMRRLRPILGLTGRESNGRGFSLIDEPEEGQI